MNDESGLKGKNMMKRHCLFIYLCVCVKIG